jgi:5-methylcytosine-specific restriction protein A
MIKRLLDAATGKAPLASKRSHEWPRVRREHLDREPACRACGGIEKLEVHHIVPFHLDPSKELDPANLVTLCESGKGGVVCHLAIGHLGNYRNFNLLVTSDASWWRSRRGKPST